jgi:hypothetical protein
VYDRLAHRTESNMKRHWRILALAIGLGVCASASAQNPFPYNQNPYSPYLQQQQNQRPPVLSPYLNNQFGGFQGPQAGYQLGDEAILDPHDPTSVMPRASGHPTTFGNTGAFFNTLGTIGPAAARPNVAGVPQPSQYGRRQ